ncbi:MAG: heme ABC exporter ATP-binding protein CcmA [Caldilineaceae bacterium]
MPPLIEVSNVHKRYGRKPVLKGVSLAVAPGQIVALLGANGAGKTTLMRVIAGLAKPDRGEINLGGVQVVRNLHELRRYIGLVAHLPLLYDTLTAWENLAVFARLYDILDAPERIEQVLRAVELWPRRHDAVRTFSRGMVQRLAIGRATLHNPPVLLLDEPDTGLDPASADLLHDLIRNLGASDRAILLTTHNLDRARMWADSVCVLADGRIGAQVETRGLEANMLRELLRTGGSSAADSPPAETVDVSGDAHVEVLA